ncbi:uncharacterized protein LOC131934753 [Physella acuta]|uniref:uncharacterized protein LOC131934753 n=1 Tax=Physella acuta TaxID=109671 RepID=UPI0027DC003C|nr:uncharacterized protein LOC131934753 [Physella acuta]
MMKRKWYLLVVFGVVNVILMFSFFSTDVFKFQIIEKLVFVPHHVTNSTHAQTPNKTRDMPGCPNQLAGMATGQWVTRPLTPEERSTIDTYLRVSRGEFHIPASYQRGDGRCGDLPYEQSPLYRHMWFKAICDPFGATPCCKTNSCLPLSQEECTCPTCYDERQAIHSEFATWSPHDVTCSVENFTSEQACRTLNGTNLYFIGDSFIRHVFVAMVIVLSDNTVNGALKKNLAPGIKEKCSGMYQITGLTCRDHLEEDHLLCNNSVRVRYREVFPASQIYDALPVLETLRDQSNSTIIFSIGIHDDFNADVVIRRFLLPFLNARQYYVTNNASLDLNHVMTNFHNWKVDLINKNNSGNFHSLYPKPSELFYTQFTQPTSVNPLTAILNKLVANGSLIYNGKLYTLPQNITASRVKGDKNISASVVQENRKNRTVYFKNIPDSAHKNTRPRLLWLGVHAPGLLKSPKFQRQTAEGVQLYNQEIQKILNQWSVPDLQTFNFTRGVVSHDGTHYGWGINMLKVNMILTYFNKTST